MTTTTSSSSTSSSSSNDPAVTATASDSLLPLTSSQITPSTTTDTTVHEQLTTLLEAGADTPHSPTNQSPASPVPSNTNNRTTGQTTTLGVKGNPITNPVLTHDDHVLDVNGVVISEVDSSAQNPTSPTQETDPTFLRTVDSFSSLAQLASENISISSHQDKSFSSTTTTTTTTTASMPSKPRSRTSTSEKIEETTNNVTPAIIIPKDVTHGRGINKHFQDPTIPPRYELKIHIIRGNITGGGLGNASNVEVFIDDLLIHRTENAPTSPYVWNETVKYCFHDLEGLKAPAMIALSLYKKRWTSSGFKLVGTAQIPFRELSDSILDKHGIIDKEFPLNVNRQNMTLTGSLYLGFQLKTINPNDRLSTSSYLPTNLTQNPIVIPTKSAFATNISLLPNSNSTNASTNRHSISEGRESIYVAHDQAMEVDPMTLRDHAISRYHQSKGTATVKFASIVPEHELKAPTTTSSSTANESPTIASNPPSAKTSNVPEPTTTSTPVPDTNQSLANAAKTEFKKLGPFTEKQWITGLTVIILVLILLNMRQIQRSSNQMQQLDKQVERLLKNIASLPEQCSASSR